MKTAPNPLLTVIIHFYNNHDVVRKHVESWKTLPISVLSKIQFICIDDFSDDEIIVDKDNLNLRLFRVIDDIDWNMPGCKNLGAVMSKTEWILFFDIDSFIESDGFEKILEGLPNLASNNLYRFKTHQFGEDVGSHVNILLLNRDSFFKMGGLDEDFAGNYGFEDIHFGLLWNKKVGPTTLITNVVFDLRNHPTTKLNRDTSINQALGTKKIYEDNFANSVGKLRFNWIEIEL